MEPEILTLPNSFCSAPILRSHLSSVEERLWPALTLVLALGFLQPVKGAVVAMQWHGRMHGFGQVRSESALRD